MIGNRAEVPGAIVVTTIQRPTESMRRLVAVAGKSHLSMVAVGDKKTPDDFALEGVTFLSAQAQASVPWKLAALVPWNHYARKNLGYLQAFASGARFIFDTDDDNAPLDGWSTREPVTSGQECLSQGWVNAYRFFSTENIWPRGLPLERIGEADRAAVVDGAARTILAPIQQVLVNGEPDVDAVWRLVMGQRVHTFNQAPSVCLAPGAWCPFNSQSTWWFEAAFPLMYLPSHVSFRMTDIWRSFVAQRCLWEMGHGVVFHAPDMVQDRNPHNLLKDFEQEVPGYLRNSEIREVLEDLSLSSDHAHVGDNLHRCYEALIAAGIVPPVELPIVDAWLADLARIRLL